jgi:hypothetical protein
MPEHHRHAMRLPRDLSLFIPVIAAGTIAALAGVYFHLPAAVGQALGGGLAGVACLVWMRGEDRTRPHVARRAAGPYVSPYEVRFDDIEVLVTRKGELVERVAWADLVTVGVHIDESFLPQPWWLLFASGGKGARYPGEARGAREMLGELQRRLPGFDNAGVIRAMGMMEGGVVLWER